MQPTLATHIWSMPADRRETRLEQVIGTIGKLHQHSLRSATALGLSTRTRQIAHNVLPSSCGTPLAVPYLAT